MEGQTCTGQSDVKYFKCSDCGKCYLDAQATELVDETTLATGHLYALQHNDGEHYRLCALCNAEQPNSRGKHFSDRYRYDAERHYKQCDVCGFVFDAAKHDNTTISAACSVCGRFDDYKARCNSRYGYDRLGTLDRGEYMQAAYDAIDNAVFSVHDDENYNVPLLTVGSDGEQDYAIKINMGDCYVYADDAFMVVSTYRNDNPLYYWISGTVSLVTKGGKDGYVTELYLCVHREYSSGADRTEQNKKVYAGIDEYMSYAYGESSAYNVAFALHDEIVRNVDYAYQENGAAQTEHWAHSVVGVFEHNSAVCEGYAKAFQLLLNVCNVDNAYVTGVGLTSAGRENHAWNLVKLDNGGWYWYDLTWDDQPNLPSGVAYGYFCKTDGDFKNHVAGLEDDGKSIDYLYELPQAATQAYASADLEYNETFSQDGFTYRLAGYDRLSVIGCVNNGAVEVPSAAVYNERRYTVRELSDTALVMSQQGADMQLICGAVSLTIPATVDVIYNKSFYDCKTLNGVSFADTEGWQRYAMTGKAPVYQQLSADKLSVDTAACVLLKELQRNGLLSGYCYVWIK